MRCARLLGPVLAVLAAALLVAPQAAAEPPFRLLGYLTDHPRALTDAKRTDVKYALNKLYTDRKIRLLSQVDALRRTEIEPALDNEDWAGAADAAANGLNTSGS